MAIIESSWNLNDLDHMRDDGFNNFNSYARHNMSSVVLDHENIMTQLKSSIGFDGLPSLPGQPSDTAPSVAQLQYRIDYLEKSLQGVRDEMLFFKAKFKAIEEFICASPLIKGGDNHSSTCTSIKGGSYGIVKNHVNDVCHDHHPPRLQNHCEAPSNRQSSSRQSSSRQSSVPVNSPEKTKYSCPVSCEECESGKSWECPECNNVNFPWRRKCNMRKCDAPKPKKHNHYDAPTSNNRKKKTKMSKKMRERGRQIAFEVASSGSSGSARVNKKSDAKQQHCAMCAEGYQWQCGSCGNANYSWRQVCNLRSCRQPKTERHGHFPVGTPDSDSRNSQSKNSLQYKDVKNLPRLSSTFHRNEEVAKDAPIMTASIMTAN